MRTSNPLLWIHPLEMNKLHIISVCRLSSTTSLVLIHTYVQTCIHTHRHFGLLTFTHCSSYLSVIKLSFLHIVCCPSDSDSKVLLSLDSSSMMPYILIYDTQTSLSRDFTSNPVVKIKVLPSNTPIFSQFFLQTTFRAIFYSLSFLKPLWYCKL